MCCTLFFRRRGWFYWIIAAAIGYSRIYLGAHWPSDVLGSVFLAAGETLLILAALELLWKWLGPRLLPHVFEHHSSLIPGGDRVMPLDSPLLAKPESRPNK